MRNQEEIKKVLADRITGRIGDLELTQTSAADYLGIAAARLSEIKRHKLKGHSIDSLLEILRVLGVDLCFEIKQVNVSHGLGS